MNTDETLDKEVLITPDSPHPKEVCIVAHVDDGVEYIVAHAIMNSCLKVPRYNVTYSKAYIYLRLPIQDCYKIKFLKYVYRTALLMSHGVLNSKNWFLNLKNIATKIKLNESLFVWLIITRQEQPFLLEYAGETTNISFKKVELVDGRKSGRYKDIEFSIRVICPPEVQDDIDKYIWVFEKVFKNKFGWKFVTKSPSVIVYLYINDGIYNVSLQLFARNIHHASLLDFGLPRLNPTIAELMLYLVKAKKGKVILDPMCGHGTILIQAFQSQAKYSIVYGDKSVYQIEMAASNILQLEPEVKMPTNLEFQIWDATNLPIMPRSVDAICTQFVFQYDDIDIHASRKYSEILREFKHILKFNGRACILVRNTEVFGQIVYSKNSPWNVLGIFCVRKLEQNIFLLTRKKRKIFEYGYVYSY